MPSREAEDLWWVEDREGVVAFPKPRAVYVERYYPEDCWLVKVDDRVLRVPMETVALRRYFLPLFRNGPWHDGGWRLPPRAG